MLTRTLEPEVMDTPEEAVDYDRMDHRAVNRLFVDHLLQSALLARVAFPDETDEASVLSVLDVGTGTAQIPIELVSRGVRCRITGIDLARHMLDLGWTNVEAAGLAEVVRLELVDAKRLPWADGAFDVVMSNSILHHIPEPIESLREMARTVRPGGLLFVRDLMRPADLPTLERLIDLYAGDANAHQRKMFGDSLHAALTLDEIRTLAMQTGIPAAAAAANSDRHWTIAWRRPE